MGGSSTRLRLRVMPGSGTPGSGVVGRYGDAWKIRVAAAPERGKANEAALQLLADRLGLDSGSLRLVSGHASRDKTVEISGLTTAEVERRLTG